MKKVTQRLREPSTVTGLTALGTLVVSAITGNWASILQPEVLAGAISSIGLILLREAPRP